MQKPRPSIGMLHTASLTHGVGGVCVDHGQGASPNARWTVAIFDTRWQRVVKTFFVSLYLCVLLTLYMDWGWHLCGFAWAAVTIGNYCLLVLETRSPRSGCQWGWIPPEAFLLGV